MNLLSLTKARQRVAALFTAQRTPKQTRRRSRSPSVPSYSPALECLERPLGPAPTINGGASDVSGLITAITNANSQTGIYVGANVINLTSSTYTFTAPADFWYGPDALPAVSSDITINGNGAT